MRPILLAVATHIISLTGYGVELRPLGPEHAAGLAPLPADEGYRWFAHLPMPSAPAMAAWIEAATADPARLPFAVLVEGEPAGTTSFYDLDDMNKRVEVGYTFYGRRFWGTHVNPACKRLLLGYAFEERGLERVALRTDRLNERSLAAISRLGALREGVLRSHMTRADGSRRDSVYFSVLAAEWPAVRAGLDVRLSRR